MPTSVLNLDLMILKNGEVRLLEGGVGVGGVGYEGWKNFNKHSLESDIVRAATQWHKKILIFDTESPISNWVDGFKTEPNYQDAKIDIAYVTSFYQIPNILKERKISTDTLIVCAPFLLPMLGKNTHLQTFLRRHGCEHPVLNGSSELIHALLNVKVATLDLFQKHLPNIVGNTAAIHLPTFTQFDSILPDASWVVIKPNLGTRAQGVIIIPRKHLSQTLKYLNGQELVPSFFSTPFGEKSIHLLHELKQQIDQDDSRTVVIQSFYIPATIEYEGKTYNPTVRAVIAIHKDSSNQYHVELIGAYNKLPMKPLSNTQQPEWSERVSHTPLNQELNQAEFKKGTYLMGESSISRKSTYAIGVKLQDSQLSALNRFITDFRTSKLVPAFCDASLDTYLSSSVEITSTSAKFWQSSINMYPVVKVAPKLLDTLSHLQIKSSVFLLAHIKLHMRGLGTRDDKFLGIMQMDIDEMIRVIPGYFEGYKQGFNQSLCNITEELLMLLVIYWDDSTHIESPYNQKSVEFISHLFPNNADLTKAFADILNKGIPVTEIKYKFSLNLAKNYFAKGDYASAYIMYSFCSIFTKDASNKASCYYNMGTCQTKLGNHAKALHDYQQCLVLKQNLNEDTERVTGKIQEAQKFLPNQTPSPTPSPTPGPTPSQATPPPVDQKALPS